MKTNSSKLLEFSWLLKKGYEESLNKVLSKYNLSQNQGSVLLFLHNNEMNTAKEISEYRSISKSLVSKSIDSLCSRNYLYIMQDQEDKRINRLYIDNSAKEVVAELRKAQKDYYALLEKDIDKDELKLLDKLLSKLYKNVYTQLKD